MAFEIPYDEIRGLQISLREEARLSTYNPEEVPDFPDLIDSSISEIDSSPAYLRCKHCKARLLRGINSIICVFCGRQHNQDMLPDPIKFISTVGCRWFLQSLDLDGSELVGPNTEANESNRMRNTLENEFPLSDLLDLVIRWPSESGRSETSVSDKTPAKKLSTLNLAGVDIENFFTDPKADSISASSEGKRTLNKQNDAMGNDAVQGHGNLRLFEYIQSFETTEDSNKDESSDWSSGWEAEFQSASSGAHHQDSKPSYPFVGSTSVDLSAQMDSVFRPAEDLFEGKTKEYTTSGSIVFKDDLWNNSSTVAAGQDEEFKSGRNDEDGGKMRTTNSSSFVNIDCIQDDRCQSTTSKADENEIVDEDDDLFDAWNDFTGSTSVQVPSNNSLKQNLDHILPSMDQASELNLFGRTSNSQDVDFGTFSQPEIFSRTFRNQNGSSDVNIMHTETSVSDRIGSLNQDGGNSREVKKGENTMSKDDDDVDMLMSQMHDLSFMLQSNFSVPQKIDPFGSFSKD